MTDYYVSQLFDNVPESKDFVKEKGCDMNIITEKNEPADEEMEMLLFRLIDWWPTKAGPSLERMLQALLKINRCGGERIDLFRPLLEPLIPLLDSSFDPSAPELVDFERAVMNFRDPAMPDPTGPHILLPTAKWPLRVHCPRFHLFEAEFDVTVNMVFPAPGCEVRSSVHRARPFVCPHCEKKLSFTVEQLNSLLRLPL